MKLISIKPSTNPEKKYTAKFKMDNDREKTVHFGQKGARDFIKTKDENLKKAYIARHKVNENFNDPTTAGALSRWILWNKPTLRASIADFKSKFNL